MYRAVFYNTTDVIHDIKFMSFKAAVDFVSCLSSSCDAIGAAIYRLDENGRPEELLRFFCFT